MKKIVSSFLASVSMLYCVAQTESEVRPVLDQYTQELIDGNWVKSLDYTYPGLFTVYPKEQMQQLVVQTFSDTSMFVIGFNSMEFGNISEVYSDDEIDYSFVNYSMQMTMRFTSAIPEENYESTLGLMRSQFGEDKVRLEGNTLIIDQDNTMAAIKTKDEEKIYFMEIKEQLFPIMEQFMSADFLALAKAQL